MKTIISDIVVTSLIIVSFTIKKLPATVYSVSGSTVTYETNNGNLWVENGPANLDQLRSGDTVTLIMSDNGTPENIYDDVIIVAEK